MWRAAALLAVVAMLLAAAGCGSDGPAGDARTTPFSDVFGRADFGGPPPRQDIGPPPCTLGLVNTCRSCTDVCPGRDDVTTERACTAGSCEIACKGENYDADEDASNGCEARDDEPAHATAATARALKPIDDCDTCVGCQLDAKLPSDGRRHITPPADRRFGVADFYRVKISDTASCSLSPFVRVDATLMSADVELEIRATFVCDKDAALTFSATKKLVGGSSGDITLDIDCGGFFGDDSGELTIEVRKTSAKGHSGASYTLIYHG